MATDDICLPSNIFLLKGDAFYNFLETTFSIEIRELARMQGFSSAYSLLHSHKNLLDFIHIDSDDSNLITMKKLAAFHDKNGTWTIKAGVQYNSDLLASALHRTEREKTTIQSDGSILVPAATFSHFPWLKSLVLFCQNSMLAEDRNDLSFLSLFIENMASNITKSSNHNRYSDLIEQFAYVLYVLGGRQAYEFVRINLPGSLPSPSTLSTLFDEKREQLVEGEFRFDSMASELQPMNIKYAFASEDCTGIIQKVSYDRLSNSFVGFCPPLQNNGCPRLFSFKIESFSDLERKFRTEVLSSLMNIYAIQPIVPQGQRSSPFLLSAFGTDNTFDSYDVLNRWLKIFDDSLQRGIRIVGFATDCDARYLRAMRMATNFFATLPNFDLRKRPNVFQVNLPQNWNWYYLDSTQLFVVFQVLIFDVV